MGINTVINNVTRDKPVTGKRQPKTRSFLRQ